MAWEWSISLKKGEMKYSYNKSFFALFVSSFCCCCFLLSRCEIFWYAPCNMTEKLCYWQKCSTSTTILLTHASGVRCRHHKIEGGITVTSVWNMRCLAPTLSYYTNSNPLISINKNRVSVIWQLQVDLRPAPVRQTGIVAFPEQVRGRPCSLFFESKLRCGF